jgi:hypothetical protein
VTDDARRKALRRYIKRETARARACEEAGGRLAYMATMTVFITDARPWGRFTQLRKEIFGDLVPGSS